MVEKRQESEEGGLSAGALDLGAKMEGLSTSSLLIIWALAFQLLLVVYSSGIKGSFVFDDYTGIAQNEDLRYPTDLARLFGDHESSVQFDRRPLSAFVMMLNYQLTGPNPTAFRVINVAIHWMIGALAFLFIRGLARHFDSKFPTMIALVSTALWLYHPLSTSTVSYCYQRIEMLMAGFFLLSLYAFFRSRSSEYTTRWLGISIAAAIASTLSKEIGLSAFPALIILDCAHGKTGKSLTNSQRTWFYGILALSLTALGVWFSTGVRMTELDHGGEIATPWGYFKYQGEVLTRYLALVIWPHPLIFFSSPRPVPSLVEALPYLLFLTTLFGLLIYKGIRQKWIWIVVGVFLSMLAPTSSFFPVPVEPEVEFRMYLPSLAVIVSLVLFLGRWANQKKEHREFLPLAAGVLVASCCVGTYQRNKDFLTNETLWISVLKYDELNEKAWANLGEYYLRNDQIREAETCAQRLFNIGEKRRFFGSFAYADWIQARVFARKGDFASSEKILRRLQSVREELPMVDYYLAWVLLQVGEEQKARETLEEVGISDAENSHFFGRILWAEIHQREGNQGKASQLLQTLTNTEKNHHWNEILHRNK